MSINSNLKRKQRQKTNGKKHHRHYEEQNKRFRPNGAFGGKSCFISIKEVKKDKEKALQEKE